MAATCWAGRPANTCCHDLPESALRQAPWGLAIQIEASGPRPRPYSLIMKLGSATELQLEPSSCDTNTLVCVAAATISPCARTLTRSFCPSTGPPCQVLPPSVLVNSP